MIVSGLTLCTYLKYLYDAAIILTVQPCPTSNLFFAEVSKVQVELTHAAFSQDPFLSSLFLPLHKNFDQYWRESCLILAIAVAMDPRHKMKLVEFTFAKIFGENAEAWIKIDEDVFVNFLLNIACKCFLQKQMAMKGMTL